MSEVSQLLHIYHVEESLTHLQSRCDNQCGQYNSIILFVCFYNELWINSRNRLYSRFQKVVYDDNGMFLVLTCFLCVKLDKIKQECLNDDVESIPFDGSWIQITIFVIVALFPKALQISKWCET